MKTSARRSLTSAFLAAVAAAVSLFAAPGAVNAQLSTRVETGTLSSDDQKLDAGEYFDRYSFQGRRGQVVTIDLQSSDFDTFLQVHTTDESGDVDDREPWFNDDFGNSRSHSRLEIELPVDGTYVILVTSYEGGETGSYELSIQTVAGRVETGKLGGSDNVLDTGEYFDVYQIEAVAGASYVIDLYSDDFDTYLMARSVDDPSFSLMNDDHEGDRSHSQIVMQTTRAGIYEVIVTSFAADETGMYRLSISDPVTPGSGSPHLDEQGELARGDEMLDSGEYFDRYAITLDAGEAIDINLASSDFDAYLFVRYADDDEFQMDNDDRDGDSTDSQIRMTAPTGGVYEVYVTSYEAGETGRYRLTVDSLSTSGTSRHREETGTLGAGDEKLETGEFYDRYSLTLSQGDEVEINLTSTDFDPYLFIRLPSDEEFQVDDDDGGDGFNAQISLVAPRAGDYEIYVTTYAGGEGGSYRLTIDTVGSSGDALREQNGELVNGDEQLDNGEFVDRYEFDAAAGESFVIDLFSDDFDTYLFVRGVDADFQVDNDDFDGDTSRSQIRMTAPAAGTYVVNVTSYAAGETGAYRMTIRSLDAPGEPGSATRREVGELDRNDGTLDSGEYHDIYEFEGRPGQHVRVQVQSDEFDTYLILQEPGGESHENDDFDGRRDMSVIELDLTASGTYRVAVTSYKKGETGTYELIIEIGGGDPGGRDRVQIDQDGEFPGRLDESDAVQDDHYVDRYTVSLTAGVRTIIRMESDDFDTLMVLTYPDGTDVEFDDEFGDLDAAIDLIPEESGDYGVTATSWGEGTTGNYTLHVTLSATGRPVGRRGNVSVDPGHRILGVFVGLSDYDGDGDDLEYCDRDAEVLYNILQREFNLDSDDSVLLLNEQATVEQVTDALMRIGERANPEDLLIFFYSGHGDQAAGGEDACDPDGIHETISLYDGDVVDDELADLINSSAAGIALVAIDSCFSGGFAKDVVSARGRMGIFSSEEDVLSLVPDRFRAGGYLSRFLAEAVSERRHESDQNNDGQLTAHELSHFLEERYLQEVRSTKGMQKSGEEFVNPEDDLSYQRLVIDRGGLSHDQVLFSWN